MTADLYIRVSTDEQADKGYSQRDQEDRLRTHCNRNGITIDRVIFEDHSAKNFDRPEWKKYLQSFKRSRGYREERLVLFTKWDRFSRNTAEAYQMISFLNKNNILPQAIEQPLDLNVPENKVLLAIYLSTPEVENERRAINVMNGMRRAIREGRLMGIAPYGYVNKCTEDGRKYIAIKEPEASNIIWAFKEVAKGHMPTAKVREAMNRRDGKNISKNAFMEALRNVAYYGNVLLRAYKSEEEKIVKGKHEPLISEELFLKVQYVLKKKGTKDLRMPGGRIINEERYPLRGLLLCPKCGKNLTASSSKGKTKHYYYYHCSSICGFRQHSEIVNDLFQKELSKYEFPSGIIKILQEIIIKNTKSTSGNLSDEKGVLRKKINDINERISKARDLFLSDKIDEDDFRDIKDRYKGELIDLEYKLSLLVAAEKEDDIAGKISKALNIVTNISERYKNAMTADKRVLVSLIYPEKIIFDGDHFQTPKVNSFVDSIFLIKKELSRQKKGALDFKNLKPCHVTSTGFKPVTF
ncbi:recombinase family protein [Chryseobacterium sp. Y16C]|uniref:recombinase family protein n=1 Tax=Chryseobacterium sp. Y16C TaxID=2920939 RepID=UPI001F0A62C7|nr:recombinase family protein [Chryseobacterium sp. Y16C]UMQ43042.1 recombinase family protein [Chryseobacterium sp. Y16C]